MSTIAVVVKGTGSIGMRHLRVLKNIAGSKAYAFPRRSSRVKALNSEGFDCVTGFNGRIPARVCTAIIATDTRHHKSDAILALKSGSHVLIEKPAAINAAQASQIASVSEKVKSKIVVGCNLRFSKSLNYLRRLLPLVGRIHSVRIECRSYLPDWRPGRNYKALYSARRNEGGVLRDLIHEIDYAGWLFGWPAKVQASLLNLRRLGIQSEESAHLAWFLHNGARLTMELDYLSRPAKRFLRVAGEKGTIEWDGISGQTTIINALGKGKKKKFSQTRDQMMKEQFQAFLGLCKGTTNDSRLATLKDGIRALAVCDAARLSSVSGRPEKVKY